MNMLLLDIRYAARIFLRNPGFTLIAVISLALGIGANSTIYSVIHAVLVRPLAVESPESLVILTSTGFSYPTYVDFRDRNEVMSGLAAYSTTRFSLNVNGRAELIIGSFASGEYFDVLGVRAARGRTFLPDEDSGTHPVAVISHNLWRRAFGGSPEVIGKDVSLNDQTLTIIGVAPPEFRGTSLTASPEVWVPIHMWPVLATGEGATLSIDRRSWSWLQLVGRLKNGVEMEQAQAELNILAGRIKEEYPRVTPRGFSVELNPISIAATGLKSRADLVRFISILAGVVGIALLIACANVANLLLARANHRRKEIAVRLALGAGRGRIIQQLLTESLLLAVMGGMLGLLLSAWAIDFLSVFELPGRISIAGLGLGINREALLVTLLISFITGIGFGLLPALQASRHDLISATRDHGAMQSAGRLRMRNALLAVQVALCMVLLVGAGLFIRGLQTGLAIDPGFETERVALASVELGLHRYTQERAEKFYEQSIEQIKLLPGIGAASWATSSPLSPGANYMLTVSYEGYRPPDDSLPEAEFNYVGDEYFKTMGVPLLAGRAFDEADRAGAPPVAVINETLAKSYFPDTDPIGRGIRIRGGSMTIVGIARDSKYHFLNESPRPYIYSPLKQNVSNVGLESMTLHVRTEGDPAPSLNALRAVIKGLDQDLPLSSLKAINEQIGDTLMAQRFGSTLLGLFGFLTLVLAAVGIYGVVSYLVSQMTREIGIRMALGAGKADILRMILSKSLLSAGIGIIAGLGAAAVMTGALKGFLYGVSTSDPTAFITAALLLGAAALLASYLPARRAVRIDPMVALRYE